ncbi:hypothetical protein BDR06DRAFT_977520 [Suillus hirtellus]|nr:hypothetical protein BDR06DRAFT_977520 [Suillus hirtellus]
MQLKTSCCQSATTDSASSRSVGSLEDCLTGKVWLGCGEGHGDGEQDDMQGNGEADGSDDDIEGSDEEDEAIDDEEQKVRDNDEEARDVDVEARDDDVEARDDMDDEDNKMGQPSKHSIKHMASQTCVPANRER